HGLTRVRGMTQDDAHLFVTPDNMEEELTKVLGFVLGLLRDYGLNDFYLELSTKEEGNPKFVGDPAVWERATETLQKVAHASGLELVPDPGGAAFYGPKISVQARDAIGRTWQMSTIQLDFNLPERFDLEFAAADGTKQRPVMIHRALFGSIERFFGVLTEHYAGIFPPWLAPVQVVGIPVADEFSPYLHEIATRLAGGLQTEVWPRAGTSEEVNALVHRLQVEAGDDLEASDSEMVLKRTESLSMRQSSEFLRQ
ncbi:MAG: threonine--tRNA ligase, partial [Actinomycetota bacterium]